MYFDWLHWKILAFEFLGFLIISFKETFSYQKVHNSKEIKFSLQ